MSSKSSLFSAGAGQHSHFEHRDNTYRLGIGPEHEIQKDSGGGITVVVRPGNRLWSALHQVEHDIAEAPGKTRRCDLCPDYPEFFGDAAGR